MGGKQTGPGWTVKALAPAGTVLFLLAACSGAGWTQAGKSAADLDADRAACDRLAEEDALSRAGRQRADYGAPPGGPTAGSYGRSPMEMRDREVTAQDFRSTFDRCMEGKGYTRGTPRS
jgi:hypothetical protein